MYSGIWIISGAVAARLRPAACANASRSTAFDKGAAAAIPAACLRNLLRLSLWSDKPPNSRCHLSLSIASPSVTKHPDARDLAGVPADQTPEALDALDKHRFNLQDTVDNLQMVQRGFAWHVNRSSNPSRTTAL